MNTYECMYIIQSNLSDDELDKANERIIEEIEKRGGSILSRERLGRKRLAYPIRKNDDGAYGLVYFDLPPGEIASLRSAYKLHPRLLRVLILRREREEVMRLQRRRPGAEGLADETEPAGALTSESAPETGNADAESVAYGESTEGPSSGFGGEVVDEEPERRG